MTIISFLSGLFRLWKEFLSARDAQARADSQKRTQDRDAAVDKLKGAQTEKEFDDAQSEIVRLKPLP